MFDTVAVMVPEGSPVRDIGGLSGQTVCLMTGSLAQRALESAAVRLHLQLSRIPFQEDAEMRDGYNAGVCGGVAETTFTLADMRRKPGRASRLLPEPLAMDPIVAVTPRGDGVWAAIVTRAIDALMLAGKPADPWMANRLPGPRLTVTDNYPAIIRRNLTERLGLAAGPNAVWPDGLLVSPAVR